MPARDRQHAAAAVEWQLAYALMENFWSMLKIELVYRNSWRTRDEA